MPSAGRRRPYESFVEPKQNRQRGLGRTSLDLARPGRTASLLDRLAACR